MALKNKISEYIRRNYTERQEVTTNLDFLGSVSVKTATKDTEAVNLGQLNSKVADIQQNVQQNIQQNIDAYRGIPITSAKLYLSQLNLTSIGSSAYGGVGSTFFVTQDKKPLFSVAWSWTADGANKYPANKYSYVWLAKNPTPTDWLSKRNIANPDNLTQEDIDYLAQFGDVMRVKIKTQALYNSNLPDWSLGGYLFKENWCKSLTSSGNINTGLIWTSPLANILEVDLDVASPLFTEIVGLQQSVTSICRDFQYNYGFNNLKIDWVLNNAKGITHFINFTKAEVITNKRVYFYTPLYIADENLNFDYFETAHKISIPPENVFLKAHWDNATNTFKYYRYNSTSGNFELEV